MKIGFYMLAYSIGYAIPIMIYGLIVHYKLKSHKYKSLPTLNEMIAEDCRKFREENVH